MPRNKQLLKARGSHPVANRRSGSTGMPQKRIVIRPYRSMPTLPANYYETTAQPLLESVLEALEPQKQTANTSTATKMSLQNAYTAVVHLVSHQFGPRLYTDLQQTLRTAAARVLAPQSRKTVLQFVPEQYGVYTDFLLVCKHVFLPLQGHDQAAGVWQVGLQVFSERLQETGWDVTLYQEWLAALLEAWERGHAAATTSNLKAVWYLWQDLGKLASLPLARDLEEYWSNKSVQLVEYHGHDSGGDVYPTQAILQYCTDKHQAVSRWTWLPGGWLWQILDQKLVQPHLQAETGLLYAPHLVPLLEREVFQRHETTSVAVASSNPNHSSNSSTWTPIQQLWMLAMRLPGGQAAVAAAICQFGRTQGLQRVMGTDKPHAVPTVTSNSAALQVVADILELQQALAVLVQTLPGGSDWINLKSVWEEVVNADVSPPLAESLAKFLDQILRSTKKMDQYQSQSGDAWLNKIVAGLFVPLQAKDVFEAFYKRDLAKRLLWNRVVSIDVEKQVCSLLKAECGAGYTSKMEGMFQDVEYSKETMNVYKQSYQQQQQNHSLVEMEVQVLTTGYWPVYPQYPSLILPDSLLAPQELFGNHYKTKYQGRRMTWQYALGHCLVRANGFSKTYELVVSLCQALVLVQFQSTESKWTLTQLCKAVGLEDRDEMERLLQSLSLGKEGTRILRKHDWDAANRRKVRMTVDDDRDVFTINHAYTSNQRRIRINNIMMKETKEEREKTVEAVSRDRLYLIDAVLVRILKARKTILHQALIPQVLEQVKVPAQPGDIKKRIESLIEREYMERDEKDRNRYNYLA